MKREDLLIFNSMPFLFWVRDKDGLYLWANSALQEIAGMEIVGLHDRDLPWGDRQQEHLDSDLVVLNSGNTYYQPPIVVWDDYTKANYSVQTCKWLEDFEGEDAIFGIAFMEKVSDADTFEPES